MGRLSQYIHRTYDKCESELYWRRLDHDYADKLACLQAMAEHDALSVSAVLHYADEIEETELDKIARHVERQQATLQNKIERRECNRRDDRKWYLMAGVAIVGVVVGLISIDFAALTYISKH